MMGLLALVTLSLWLLWAFYYDVKGRASVSSSVWIVVAWLFIHGTRPLTMWLGWNVTTSRDEGNPVEAMGNLILIVAGLIVLLRRGIRWPAVIRDNTWLFVFYLFWSVSIAWSDYPVITFKRLFKDIGNVAMVLIVLTDREPSEAIRAVCVRFAYLCVPLSIVLIRFYPDWGRTYVGYHGDTLMYTGVTTHKNMLGVLVFVSTLFVLWDLLEHWGKRRTARDKLAYASGGLILCMCWYLLLTIDSMTALICATVGSVLLIALGLPFFRLSPARMEAFGLSAAAVVALFDWMFNVKEIFIEGLGRNMTLTSRTDIWEVVRDFQDNPLVGAGFDTFWAGERFELLADKTFGIIQAHNGYLETYLNGGFIGVGLLVILLLSAYKRIRKQLILGRPEGRAKFAILFTAIIHNYAEANFLKVGVLWFVTVFAIMEYRAQHHPRQSVLRSALLEQDAAIGAAPNSIRRSMQVLLPVSSNSCSLLAFRRARIH